jgi:hypothetical protein
MNKGVVVVSEQSTQVVNAGTAENPNFFGSAYAMGRLHGIRDVLAALRALDPEDEYKCQDVVKAMLPKGVEW